LGSLFKGDGSEDRECLKSEEGILRKSIRGGEKRAITKLPRRKDGCGHSKKPKSRREDLLLGERHWRPSVGRKGREYFSRGDEPCKERKVATTGKRRRLG